MKNQAGTAPLPNNLQEVSTIYNRAGTVPKCPKTTVWNHFMNAYSKKKALLVSSRTVNQRRTQTSQILLQSCSQSETLSTNMHPFLAYPPRRITNRSLLRFFWHSVTFDALPLHFDVSHIICNQTQRLCICGAWCSTDRHAWAIGRTFRNTELYYPWPCCFSTLTQLISRVRPGYESVVSFDPMYLHRTTACSTSQIPVTQHFALCLAIHLFLQLNRSLTCRIGEQTQASRPQIW